MRITKFTFEKNSFNKSFWGLDIYIPGTFLGTRMTVVPKTDNISVCVSSHAPGLFYNFSSNEVLTCAKALLYDLTEPLEQLNYHLHFLAKETNTERLNMLPKVTQLGSGEARIQNTKTRTLSFCMFLDFRYNPEHESQEIFTLPWSSQAGHLTSCLSFNFHIYKMKCIQLNNL